MDQSLYITLIQTDLRWEDKAFNHDMLEKKILGIKEKTEIVVLPEMFSTGFSMKPEGLAENMEGETVTWMKRVSREKKIILTGSFIAKQEGKFYNRLVWMLPNGQHGHYDKRHLFAYAGEDEQYTPGSKRFIASVKGWKINLLICYDLRFPVWSRQALAGSSLSALRNKPGASENIQVGAEYDVLIYVANWPEKRIQAWKTLLQARAIENQCYVIGVNRTGDDGNNFHYSGDSMVVDPMGEVLYSKTEEEDIYTIVLDKSHLINVRERLPFLRDADQFEIR